MADPSSRPEAQPYPAVLEAAAHLGLNPGTLRYHLAKAGHLPQVQPDGRAYLTVTLAEADEIVRTRRQASRARREKLAGLPGLSAQQVAYLLGIQVTTVYRLSQLRYLPAETETMIGRRKILRWNLGEVKAYAQRVGRTLTE